MGFVFSGMTSSFLLSPFLAGIVYAKAGYFPVFALVIAILTVDLLLRTGLVEKKTAAQWDEPKPPSSTSPYKAVICHTKMTGPSPLPSFLTTNSNQ